MDGRARTQQAPSVVSAGMDHSEEMLAELDDPPDERRDSVPSPHLTFPLFDKATSGIMQRRESLLTRQLHSEAEQTDDELAHGKPRLLSTQSTWSNPSVASTAELTSDDGHSVASPGVSPPLPPTRIEATILAAPKAVAQEPKIVEPVETNLTSPVEAPSEKTVEAGLGRKRCISFACGGKDKKPPTSAPTAQPDPPAASSPPKRKMTLKFACPMSRNKESKEATETATPSKRPSSPSPEPRHADAHSKDVDLAHGSPATVVNTSPKLIKARPVIVTTVPTPTSPLRTVASRKYSNDDSEDSTEATRFHEFASSDDEPEEWVQEATCHRSRLTVDDTLKKETYLRKACEEAEEEVIDEEENDEDEEENNVDDEVVDEDELLDDVDEQDAEEDSDEGFHTDDEDGFAESDSEGEGSEYDWWTPGALSTAATSVDHLDRRLSQQLTVSDAALASSQGSASSGHLSARVMKSKSRRKPRHVGMPIEDRPAPVDLPDSTDFVCGTLDEDRPLEQAFLNTIKAREAAKHKLRPQDIDPTFPTSDPDMDEEDDEDLEESEHSEEETMMHGELDELDGESTVRAKPSMRSRALHRSPPPPARPRSPAPVKKATTARSPAPAKRLATRSPPPRKLFGHSPQRARSPAPGDRMPSPPNTRRISPSRSSAIYIGPSGLATRPQLTHTASLPRGGHFMLSQLGQERASDADTVGAANGDFPKRGAIDIVKGLEKKRQRRKERLYQKACAKAAAKGDKAYKVKPGKGAERMRELGLELQRYRGKGEHILSM